jgi:large subunit ribosomal protein L10
MPTEAKEKAVADLVERMTRSSIAIATDFSGLSVNQVTQLRKQLRELGSEYKVVKNRIALIAAQQSGREYFKDIVEGSTGIVFGYGDVVAAAKGVDAYVKESRAELTIRKGVMNGAVISAAQISDLAALPPKEQLLAMLLGQMNAPITGLLRVLNGTISGLAIVLQRRAEQLDTAA